MQGAGQGRAEGPAGRADAVSELGRRGWKGEQLGFSGLRGCGPASEGSGGPAPCTRRALTAVGLEGACPRLRKM